MILCGKQAMPRHNAAVRERVRRIKEEYRITEKQAALVDLNLQYPEMPQGEKILAAGYSPGSVKGGGAKVIHSDTVRYATMTEAQKKAVIDAEIQEMEKDPRGFLKKRLIDHAKDPTVTANQTHALELVGKLDGLFVERIEVDPGQNLRSSVAGDLISRKFLAKPSEEIEEAS